MEIEVQGLLAALSDPEKVVRIASLRALVRLPLGSDTAAKLRPLRAEYERRDISWATWVPDEETAGQISKLVALPEEEERALARKIAATAKSPITKRFARLALGEYDPPENLLTSAELVATDAYKMGSEFAPDIRGLFEVYGVFLRRAADFWFDWVRNFPTYYDPSRELPPWFSSHQGALAVSRQIEWTVSRAELPVVLSALNDALKGGGSRERFAAAQLIEWARRTASVKQPWSFGGGAGPEDVFDFDNAAQLEYKKFAPEALPVASARAPALRPPGTPKPTERKINFWIKEAENIDLKLESGTAYTVNVRVGKPVVSSLIRGPDSTIPDSDVPPGGLRTDWTILPTDVHLEALDPVVSVSRTGLATFSLLVPETGESETVQFRLTPQSAKAKLQILIFIGGKLYRELEVSLESEAYIVKDDPLTRAAETDLQTGNEWTTPPGVLTMRVWKTAKAVISGFSGVQCFPEGQEISIGTAKSELSKVVDSLRAAAENFRAAYTAYLNDIDGSELQQQLAGFQPQYDWSQLSYSADPAHEAAWNKAANSQELRDVAFYGRRLYDTLFPPQSDSRVLLEQLPPGQLIQVVWRQDSGADWVPDLPWSLLYVGDVDSGVAVDGTKFWGLRFRIGYTAYNPKGILSSSLGKPTDASCTSLLFFGDSKSEPATEEARWQRAYWASLGSKSRHCIVPSDGAAIPKDELKAALKKPEALGPPPKTSVAVLYLFCHYGADAGGTPILRFGLDASEPGDIIREPELGTEQLASRPLVFANACATAGGSVYSANTIIKTFFDRGCRAFIGTECMVPAVMASRFAVIFFHFLLRLVDKRKQPMAAGEALAQTRLFLWTHYKNVGGLLYSYLNHYDLYMADEAEIKALWKTL